MKKSCLGCKALLGNNCMLMYKTKSYDILGVAGAGTKPIEECPKPKTIGEYTKLLEKMKYKIK